MEQRYIKDNDGNIVLPITSVTAVRDNEGQTLAAKIEELELKSDGNNNLIKTEESRAKNAESSLHSSVVSTNNALNTERSERTAAEAQLRAELNAKQYEAEAIELDAVPTKDSTKMVNSGAVYTALQDMTYDVSIKHPASGVDSGNTYTLSGALAVIPAADRKAGMSIKFIDSEKNEYVQYRFLGATTDGFTTVGNWQGVDSKLVAGSRNLAESGEVQNELALGAVYDVSAKNPTAGPNNDGKFESLSALFSDTNINTLIPIAVRKGGMSFKFVQTSDNKYVQYRYTSSSTAAADFTNVYNWQGIDDDGLVTIDSDPITKNNLYFDNAYAVSYTSAAYALKTNGKFSASSSDRHVYFKVNAGDRCHIDGIADYALRVAFATTSTATGGNDIPVVSGTSVIEVPANTGIWVKIPEGCTHLLLWRNNATTGFDIKKAICNIDKTPTIGSKNPVESGAVAQQIITNIDGHVLEIGGISGGSDVENYNRARSKGYIRTNAEISVSQGYVLVGRFNYNKNQDGSYSYVSYTSVNKTGEHISIVSSNEYARLLFKKSDDSNFTNSELNSIFIVIRALDVPSIKDLYDNTDKYEKLSCENWLHAYVNTSLEIVASENSRCSQPVLLNTGDILHVESVNDYKYPIVIMSSNESIAVGDTLSPMAKIERKDDTMPHTTYTATKQCYAVISTAVAYSRIYIIRNNDITTNTVISRYAITNQQADLQTNLYINASNVWKNGTSKNACFFVVYAGSLIEISANNNYNTIYALLRAPLAECQENSSPEFIDKSLSRHTVNAGTTIKLSVDETCYLYVYHHDSSNNVYWPSTLNIICPSDNHVRILTLDNADIYLNKGINNNNVWKNQHTNIPASCAWNVKRGSKITVKASSSQYAIIVFLSSTAGSVNETANFANNTNTRVVVPAGETQTFDVATDCLFYSYIQSDSGTTYFPESILYDLGVQTLSGISPKTTRFAVNLLNSIEKVSGLDNLGRLTFDYNHLATKPISIFIGDNWYQTAKYLHCCCYKDGEYKFCASKVVFLSESLSVVSVETDITSAIEIPNTAKFVAVEFPYGSNHHFVSTNNQSLLKTYSEYNEANLIADTIPNYDKIKNSPATVSHLLDIALDYYPYPYLGLGYGNIATAYDDVVEPVESELPSTSPQHYSGEKMQINCSTFVMLCLQGISYKNSRYVTPNGINIGDGYIFDEQAEYNYHYTTAPYQYIFGANWGKMYANKLAKYAFDRGLLFMVKPDLSNIQAGDVLFEGSASDANFFLNIGHTMLVSDIELKADGSKRVITIENGSYSRVITNEALWGARFPLPCRTLTYDNVVSNFTPISTEITVAADTDTVVGALNLAKSVTGKHHYTLCIKGVLPDTVNIGIKSGSTKIEIDRRSLYKRGDNVNTKHFNIYQNDSIDANQFDIYINSSEALTAEPISIESVSLAEGWHIL